MPSVCMCVFWWGGGDICFCQHKKNPLFFLTQLSLTSLRFPLLLEFHSLLFDPSLSLSLSLVRCEGVAQSKQSRDRERAILQRNKGMEERVEGSAKEMCREILEVMDTPERSKNSQIATSISKFEV